MFRLGSTFRDVFDLFLYPGETLESFVTDARQSG